MSGYDTLLLLHLLGAFTLATGTAFLIPVMFRANVGEVAQQRLLRLGGALAGGGAGVAVLFGLLLVANRDYGFFDGWIIGSLVLWLISTTVGPRIAGPESRRLFFIAAGASTLILVLMIFKPGA